MHKQNYDYIYQKYVTYQQWAIFSFDMRTMPLEKTSALSILIRSRGSKDTSYKKEELKTSNQQSQTPMQRWGNYQLEGKLSNNNSSRWCELCRKSALIFPDQIIPKPLAINFSRCLYCTYCCGIKLFFDVWPAHQIKTVSLWGEFYLSVCEQP